MSYRIQHEIYKCRKEWDPIADSYIVFLKGTQLLAIVIAEKGEPDIVRHTEDPERVSHHEPV